MAHDSSRHTRPRRAHARDPWAHHGSRWSMRVWIAVDRHEQRSGRAPVALLLVALVLVLAVVALALLTR